MTAYTADDFKNAWFARHPRTEDIAMRAKNSPFPWWVSGGPNSSDAGMAHDGWIPVQENPHPLTPDAITDEMVERARVRLREHGILGYLVPNLARDILTAALTEPPARPEGAEELETVIGLNAGKWTDGAEDVRALADLLASQGVRVVGEEQP